MSYKKCSWKFRKNSQENTYNAVSFLINLQTWDLQIHEKRNSDRGVFLKFLRTLQCVKSVRIRSFSGPYFPAFWIRRDTEYGEIRPQIWASQNVPSLLRFLFFLCLPSLEKKIATMVLLYELVFHEGSKHNKILAFTSLVALWF